MKALEFKAKIDNNKITVPDAIGTELMEHKNKSVRVIILFDDPDLYEDSAFEYTVREQFLKGYSDSDSIYDN